MTFIYLYNYIIKDNYDNSGNVKTKKIYVDPWIYFIKPLAFP